MITIAISTFSDESHAVAAVRTLVSEAVVACGTLLPGSRSIYRWKDQVEDNHEVVVLFKLTAENYQLFETRLREIHPYETPEILAIQPIEVFQPYADWVRESCALADTP